MYSSRFNKAKEKLTKNYIKPTVLIQKKIKQNKKKRNDGTD